MNNKDYVIVKDGEMVHFKYIKREKVNGEWRYYYDKGSIGRSIKKAVGIDARNAYRSARDSAETARVASGEALTNMQKEAAEAKATKAEADAAKKEIPTVSTVSDKELQRLQNHYATTVEAVAVAKKELAAAKNAVGNMQSAPGALGSTIKNATTVALKDSGSSTEIKAAQDKLARAEQAAEQARSAYNAAFKASQEAKKTQPEIEKATKKADVYSKVAEKQAAEANEARINSSKASTAAVEAQKKAEEALKKYYKTPLGSLKFLSDKGKELLYKIF